MFRKRSTKALALGPLSVVVCLLTTWATPGGAQVPDAASDAPTTRYIVVYQPTVANVQTAAIQDIAQYGIDIEGLYQNALKGYVASMTDDEKARLTTDPDVAYIEEDRLLFTADQIVPTGVQRISAATNTNLDIDDLDDNRIDVDVAVIDTGVQPNPDLYLRSRVDCSPGSCLNDAGSDDNGHGTHVAGTVGAIDNSVGVVGVAPGARIHGLKVCNAYGECPNSAILAAIDWVTARSATIEVVNMSLIGPGVNNPLDQAITKSVDAGVVYVVAAGNNGKDAAGYSPASSPDVIAVSAIADSDGKAGGTGPAPPCRPSNVDDRLADFSNYGAVVDIAAPGVCIRSTWKDGTTQLMSGTSMAAPHVAGAAAILTSGPRDPLNRAGVMAVRKQLLDSGTYLWSDTSPDDVKEPLLNVGNKTLFPPSTGPTTTTTTTTTVPTTTTTSTTTTVPTTTTTSTTTTVPTTTTTSTTTTVPTTTTTVWSDDFESTTGGWVVNPYNTDTAASGKWQRADPAGTAFGPIPLQLANTTSGVTDLVTGAPAGADLGAGDIDSGVTRVRSGLITLPASGALTLTTRYYLSYLSGATADDYLRISVEVGTTRTTVFEVKGVPNTNKAAAWTAATADLTAYAGEQIRFLITASDSGNASTVEAAVDDVKITQQR